MAIISTVTAETDNGKTLDTLMELIRKRSEVFRKDAQDAGISMAIWTLTSLRSATREAKRPGKCTIERRGDLVPGFTNEGGAMRRCLRMGNDRKAPRFQTTAPVRWQLPRMELKNAKVFFVTPVHEARAPYFAVAYSVAAARQIEAKRAASAIERYGGLARTMLGVAMAKLSTRNNEGNTTKKTIEVLKSKLVEARTSVDGDTFSLFVHDKLNYAALALRKGMTVQIAMQKAANRTAGVINNYLKRQGRLDEIVSTPFPEVSRRRT